MPRGAATTHVAKNDLFDVAAEVASGVHECLRVGIAERSLANGGRIGDHS